ncbi:hypothetical protein IWQ61_003345 [Dispira simplex]|nr:hypothetical protein IWQ61_003345 [Dispira simplex]
MESLYEATQSTNSASTLNLDSHLTNLCPICLTTCTGADTAYVDGCFHAYCFTCIQQWYRVDTQCPLCRRTMVTLIYDVQGSLYKRYSVRNVHSDPRPVRCSPYGKGPEFTDEMGRRKRRSVYAFRLEPCQSEYASNTSHDPQKTRWLNLKRHPFPDRVKQWITRELDIILNNENDIVVLEYIMAHLQR